MKYLLYFLLSTFLAPAHAEEYLGDLPYYKDCPVWKGSAPLSTTDPFDGALSPQNVRAVGAMMPLADRNDQLFVYWHMSLQRLSEHALKLVCGPTYVIEAYGRDGNPGTCICLPPDARDSNETNCGSYYSELGRLLAAEETCKRFAHKSGVSRDLRKVVDIMLHYLKIDDGLTPNHVLR